MRQFVVVALCALLFSMNGGPGTAVGAGVKLLPGTIKGEFAVSLGGSAQYNLPLEMPVGTAGMAPNLLLNYDSNAGAGPLGIGWSVAGLSHISRATSTNTFDGFVAPVSFTDRDSLSLDGARLIEVPSAGPNRILVKFIDDGNRLEEIRDASGTYYISRTKSGLRMYYGDTENSRIRTPSGAVLYWACSRIEDTFGNEIGFTYIDNKKGDWGILAIEYTKNDSDPAAVVSPASRVDFSYHQTTDSAVSYLGGELLTKTLVLDGMRSTVGGQQFRRYEFSYDPQPETGRFGARRLRAIQEFGTDDSTRPPTTFDYSDANAEWKKVDTYGLPSEFGSSVSVSSAYRVADLDGDGVSEIAYSANFIDASTGALRPDRKTFKLTNGSWAVMPDLALPEALASSGGSDNGALLVDIDGDKSLEFLVSTATDANGPTSLAYRIVAGKWTSEPSFAFPLSLSTNGKRSEIAKPATLAGVRGLITLGTDAARTPGVLTFWQFSSGWTGTPIETSLVEGLGASTDLLALDLDCDGADELAVVNAESGKVTVLSVSRSSSGKLEATSGFDRTYGPLEGVAEASIGACGHLILQTQAGDDRLLDVFKAADGSFIQAPFDLGAIDPGTVREFTVAKVKTGDDNVIVHLNGSSVADAIVAVFDANSGKWNRNPAHDYDPGTAVDRTPDNWLTAVADMDGNSVPDVVFLPTQALQAPVVLLGAPGGGWTLGRQYAPDIAFAQQNKLGLEPQFVDLNGDHLTDAVGSNRDAGGVIASVASINTGGGWIDDVRYQTPLPLTDEKSGRIAQLVDIDADSNVDFLYAYKGVYRLWRNKFSEVDGVRVPEHWQEETGFTLPSEDMAEENAGDLGVRFVDVNGNGRVDMLVARRDASGALYSRAYLNTEAGFRETPAYRLPAPVVSRYGPDVSFIQAYADFYRDLAVQFLDVNADGLPDMVFRYRFQPQPATSSGSQRECINHDTTQTENGNTVVILDPIPTDTTCAGVFLNTGSGWAAADEAFIPPIDMDVAAHDASAQISYLDLDRDDLADLVLVGAGGNRTYLNTGKGWAAYSPLDIPAIVANSAANVSNFRLVDVDGDGSLDLIFSRPDASGAFTNTGVGWKASSSLPPPQTMVDGSGTDLGVRVIDVDGNGFPDLVRSWKDTAGTTANSAYLNVGTRPDVLVQATNGLGLAASFSYLPISLSRAGQDPDDAVYRSSGVSAYPIIEYVPSMFVVSRLTIREAPDREITTDYRYANFRLDAENGMVLGFESRVAHNNQSGIAELSASNQSLELGGTLKSASSSLAGVTLSNAGYEYEVVALNVPSDFPKRVDLVGSNSETRDLNGAVVGRSGIVMAHDPAGNVLSTCTTYGDGSWNLTSNTYDDSAAATDPTVWFVGRLMSASSLKAPGDALSPCDPSATGTGIIFSSSEFTYDPKTGVLLTETANVDTPLPLQTTYGRDRFGNVAVTTTTDVRNRSSRTSSVIYEGTGRFVVKNVDALGHGAVRTIDPVSGQVSTASDINGVSAEATYDGFGRQIAARTPTGRVSTDTVTSITGVVVENQMAVVVETMIDGDLPPSSSYVDLQGRVLRTVTTADGGRLVNVDNVYDLFGRVVRQSLPYYQGDTPLWSTTTYDALSRPLSTTGANGSKVLRAYDGLTVTTTDPFGKVTKEVRDLKGLVVEAIDTAGTRIRFAYDANDRLVDTTGPGGGHIRNTYDSVGNRVRTDDPDLGEWRYAYNAFGEVVFQIDARGQLVTLSYDQLGRVVQQVYPDQTTKWTYDAGPNALGSLVAVSRSDGYGEDYQYDNLGRMVRREVTAANRSLAAGIEYDDLNRPSTVFYPGGFATHNVFNEWGFLSSVSTSDPDHPFADWHVQWTSEARDQYGRVVSETLANGVRTKRAYDPSTGYQQAITTLGAKGQKLADLSLKYDLVGNLVEKIDTATKRRESFVYDPMYRLTTWKVNGEVSGSYAFDEQGRFTSKSGVGTYHYDEDAPAHAVSSISGPAGKTAYRYDADGNEILGPNGQFSYYGNNLVRMAFQNPSQWSTFVYGSDQSRVYEIDRRGADTITTLSLGTFEEIEQSGLNIQAGQPNVTRHRLYVSGDTGVVAVLEHVVQHDPFLGAPSQGFASGRGNDAIARLNLSSHYLIKDQLGSVTGITDATGKMDAIYEYDPWGERQLHKSKPATGWTGLQLAGHLDRGFTGHQQLDAMDLVHMNGRIYDPHIAQFISADSTLETPSSSVDYARYAYVGNNPLRYTDPTGHGFLGDLWHAVSSPFEKIGQWIGKNWKTVVIVVVAVVITVASSGTLGPVAAGMLAGAAAGGLGAALYGGNILEGAITGAVFGGLSAGFGSALGASVAADFGQAAGLAAQTAGRGLISGLQAEYYGGGFWQGFATGAVTAAFSGYIQQLPGYLYRTAANFVLGGTASVVGGGKFENAAITSAYSSLLGDSLVEAQRNGQSIGSGLLTFGNRLINIATKVITWPNTAIGVAWGLTNWAFASAELPRLGDLGKYNALVFRNAGWMRGGAITFGNAVVIGGSDGQDFEEMMGHEEIHTYQAQGLGLAYLPANVLGTALSAGSAGWAWGRGPDVGAGWMHGNMNFMEGAPWSNNLYGAH